MERASRAHVSPQLYPSQHLAPINKLLLKEPFISVLCGLSARREADLQLGALMLT